MRLKYYLRGLGIGIICTAIIMGIAFSGNKKETLTDTEIIERARMLGMVMPEGTSETEEDVSKKETDGQKADEQKTEVKNPVSKSAENHKSQNTDNGTTKKTEDETNSGQDNNNNKKTENNSNGQDETSDSISSDLVDIEIAQGDYSSVVCQKLYAAGLITNADEFNDYMVSKGVDGLLHVGKHQIPKGATRDEILDILQEKPQ